VRDEEDCGRWLARLDAVARRRRWRVVAFVVMPSHYHLLVETPGGDLSAGMHDLNAGYAMAFNWRHGRHGPLFAGRFKAILVEPGYRYWEISRHIHLNPVRLGHAKRPQDWPFGSCQAYVDGTVLAPAWLVWRPRVRTATRAAWGRSSKSTNRAASATAPPTSACSTSLRRTTATCLSRRTLAWGRNPRRTSE